jgi:hypothetical protein
MHQRENPPKLRETPPPGPYSPLISRSRRFRAVIRSFIFSDSADPRVFFLDGAGVDTAGFMTWQYAQPCFNPCLHSLDGARSMLPSYPFGSRFANIGMLAPAPDDLPPRRGLRTGVRYVCTAEMNRWLEKAEAQIAKLS